MLEKQLFRSHNAPLRHNGDLFRLRLFIFSKVISVVNLHEYQHTSGEEEVISPRVSFSRVGGREVNSLNFLQNKKKSLNL